MAPQRERVVFARINRRPVSHARENSFAEDMARLAGSHLMRYQEVVQERTERAWIAADMAVQPDGDFMTGTLGYTDRGQRRILEDREWSWIKAQVETDQRARPDTVVPFALDLREDQRWLALSPARRLKPKKFVTGFEHAIRAAAYEIGLSPEDWEVDLVVSRERIDEWIQRYPAVHLLRRTVKFPNPGRNLDSDREEMRTLNAQRMTEELEASSRGVLDISAEEFRVKLEGVQTGDIDLYLKSRRLEGSGSVIFSTAESPDYARIDNFVNLFEGVSLVLEALRQYVIGKSADRRFNI